MRTTKKRVLTVIAGAALGLMVFSGNAGATLYNQDVTPDVIFGSGNANGFFAVDQNSALGIELGIRGKVRFNGDTPGTPENTFNSDGAGNYYFDAGVPNGQSFPTAHWTFEWSINSDYNGSGDVLDRLNFTYVLGIDIDPTASATFVTFDPIHGVNPNTSTVWWDHAIGDNSTGNGGGSSASGTGVLPADVADYDSLINSNNVAQNSWRPNWIIPGFDPTTYGTYSFYLAAFESGVEVARTDINIVVTPEPLTMAMLGFMGVGMVGARRLRKRKA